MTRRRTPAAPPALHEAPHRHLWQPADDGAGFVCPECPAAASACASCRRPVESGGRTCDDCVSRARNDLRMVRDLYRQLPDVIAAIAGLHAVRYDRGGGGKPVKATDTTITGGEALVLAAGGYANKTRLGAHEAPSSVDPALLAAERTDPPSVLAILTFWEDAFRAERGDVAAPVTSVDAAVAFLVTVTDWAAQTSAQWDDYRRELRDLLWRLRRLTGDTEPAVPENIPCVHCGGRVIRVWSDEGLTDVRRCQQCGMSWPDVDGLRFTNHLRVLASPVSDPEALVTLDQARLAIPDLKRNTLNQVLKRDRDRQETDPTYVPRLPERGRNVRGEMRYRLGDIAAIITSQEATA